jgi:cbb3-type cytochrome oxidase maturation protein
MTIVNFLVPLALLLGLTFVVAFIWGLNSEQFDDLESPKHRMLYEKENENE